MSKGAVVNAYPESNLLVVADQAARIQRLIQIINQIDIAGLIDIELIPLEFARSQAVIQLLNRLVPALRSGPEQSAAAFTVIDDPRSNSILMTGDPIVRGQLRGLIKKLDKPVNGDSHTQVVFVNYAKASSLLPALESVSGSLQEADRDQKYANMDIKIVVNEENNALVITAPPLLQDTIKSVIRQLDVRRSQVLVEALIVEVNDELMRDLGVRWRTVLDREDVFVGSNTLGTLGSATPPNLADGLTLGFYSNRELRGLLRVLESDSDSNILSTPTIVALDNKEAEILVGSNVPFITGSSTGSSSSTDNPFQTIQRKDIGVTLRVKPQINNDGSITLEVEQSVESISPSRASDIITNKRRIRTEVLIENDEVLVLGGLITDELNESEERVPILGHIPVLGHAFKSNKRQINKRNLMVFIHPRILESRAGNDALTRDRYDNFKQMQRRFNEEHTLFSVPKGGPLLAPMPALDNDGGTTP
jgi:general secretion pathway protein D